MPNFTALYSFYCRPMESDDTWITTGFLIDTRFYGFLRCSGGRVERVFLGGQCGGGLYADDSTWHAPTLSQNVSVRFYD